MCAHSLIYFSFYLGAFRKRVLPRGLGFSKQDDTITYFECLILKNHIKMVGWRFT
ncbi:MAG: hypothetical protein BAJALOKI1v1_1810006 [Promethearchaeota archaeon]|nr:MAG: hypothetical protein BAJALOKI1v1_1810006 [Candidatus Lokiarchaeota archaeon]